MTVLTSTAPARPLFAAAIRRIPPALLVVLAVLLTVTVIAVTAILGMKGIHHTGAMYYDTSKMYYD